MRWDASDVEVFLGRILLLLTATPIPSPGKLASLLVRSGVTMTAMLAHWIQIRSRAERIGREDLPDMLSRIPEGRVSVVGFSLGALIVYHGLLNARQTEEPLIHNAVLLSGAVPHGDPETWACALAGLEGRLVNVYNPQDTMLKYLFRIAQLSPEKPCGLTPVELSHPRLFNVRAGGRGAAGMRNHWGQIDTLPETVGWLFR
jgi:pimeloyl-ACP methyl ester carboxylesterase